MTNETNITLTIIPEHEPAGIRFSNDGDGTFTWIGGPAPTQDAGHSIWVFNLPAVVLLAVVLALVAMLKRQWKLILFQQEVLEKQDKILKDMHYTNLNL